MISQAPTKQFLQDVRKAILQDASGGSVPESEHFLDGLDLRGYKIGSHLGTGGAGVVYSATDPHGQKVAVKVMPLPEEDSAVTVFQREVRIGQTLEHPSIVQTLHTFAVGPAQFVIMELVEGTSLREVMNEPLDTQRFLDIFGPLTEGLSMAHSKGVVHRDLKPENVMLASDGAVKILDFGMARLVEDGSVTMTGTFKGTVRYSAPEQLADSKRAGPACDQFALGLMMFEAISGKFPYPAHKAPMQEVVDRVHKEPACLSDVDSSFGAPLSEVLARMLARDPEQRYPDVRDAFEAVAAATTRA